MVVIESLNHVSITVSDLEASVKFYKELFDFEVVEQISSSGQAFLKMGDILIVLNELEGYKNQQNTRNCISFYIDEEDFEDAIDEIKENDIKIIYGPENIRNGQSVIFMDPDGNHIELSYPRVI